MVTADILGIMRADVTTVAMNSVVFWYVTTCNPVEIHQRFGVTHCLRFQSRRVGQANKKHISLWSMLRCLAYFWTLKVEAVLCSETLINLLDNSSQQNTPNYACLAYSSSLKLEAVQFAETSVQFQAIGTVFLRKKASKALKRGG